MVVHTERQDGILIARADGRVDSANAGEFQNALNSAIDEHDDAVILDLAGLSYISSAGLRVLLMIAKMLQGKEAKFAVCSAPEPIREIFEISGFDKIIPTHDSQAEAITALSA